MSNDFLIQTSPDGNHRLCLTWSGDRNLIYLHTNSRTMGMSRPMAEELVKGLQALLLGNFDRALSETALRLEIEDAEFRARRIASSTPPRTPPPSQPELDSL